MESSLKLGSCFLLYGHVLFHYRAVTGFKIWRQSMLKTLGTKIFREFLQTQVPMKTMIGAIL
jgi:hypothetical protein